MKAKTIKRLQISKKKALNIWYFCMKPLAKCILYIDNRRSAKNTSRLEKMTLEEVARLYVKYTVKYIAKRKDSRIILYNCSSKNGYSEYYDDGFILSDLSSFSWSRFNKTKLHGWYCTSPECRAIDYGEGHKDRWIALENKLRLLVENEFIRAGCSVEHIDESSKLDEWFVRQSGYIHTVVVTI